MYSTSESGTAPKAGEHYQVVDGRDEHYRKIGKVIGMHGSISFPICLEFKDEDRSVYYAYQVRRVIMSGDN